MKKTTQTFLSNVNVLLEAVLVLSLGFGLFIYSSSQTAFFTNSKVATTQSYNSFDFIFIAVYELIVLIIISYFLKYRHWTLKDFNLDFTPIMFGVGLLLAFIRISSGIGLGHIIESLNLFNPNTLRDSNISLQSNFFSIAIIVIVNSFFEEFLLIGYLFKRFEKYHVALVILISSIVRASFHTYQGWQNVLGILIMALIFGFYYTRQKKLWPIIIAHAIGNIFYFLNENYHWIKI